MSEITARNKSVFGDVIANDEINDFLRLVNITRDIFKQGIAVLEIMPGGLTNKNFRAVLEDGTQIAIRLAGQTAGSTRTRTLWCATLAGASPSRPTRGAA